MLEAEEELKRGVPDERVYDVVLAATGDEEHASAEFTRRLAERARRSEEPTV